MKIFISYATKDSNLFRIKELVSRLEQLSGVDEVWYWERDSARFGSIVKYMEYCVPESDIILAISTKNSLTSKAVENELDLAIYENKRIIPVFVDINEVRALLKPKPGVKYDPHNDDFNQFVNKIYGILGMIPTPGLPTDSSGGQNKIELVKYNGVSLIKEEYQFLNDLEKEIGGNVIPNVSHINRETLGFIAEANHIVGLGLYDKGISSIPESIGNLKNLKELYLPGTLGLHNLPKTITKIEGLSIYIFSDTFPEIYNIKNGLFEIYDYDPFESY